MNEKITFKVSGMSCNGCAASIGRALSRLDGMKEATADFAKGIAEVAFNDSLIDKQRVVEVIEDLGYHVEGEL